MQRCIVFPSHEINYDLDEMNDTLIWLLKTYFDWNEQTKPAKDLILLKLHSACSRNLFRIMV